MRIGRRLVLAALLVLVAMGLVAAWQAFQLKEDLSAAEGDVDRLDAALRGDDLVARNQAAKDLTDHAAAAADRSDGFVWGLVEHTPVYGDDAAAVSAVSRSLDTLATGAVQPLLYTVDSLDGLTGGGRIDIDKLESVKEPVQTARKSAEAARKEVQDLDSDDYVGPVRDRIDTYVDRLDDLVDGLGSGERALKVLPAVLGSEGPRDYLLVFQNNAEIRGAGGIPGSWAQVHTDDGDVLIKRQGHSISYPQEAGDLVLPISDAERAVYSDLLGRFWQDATFTPNWPRAAELLKARWEAQYSPTKLDGVISIDPVAMSYLLTGTGPIVVDGLTLAPETLVDQLLNQPYLTLGAEAQDKFFDGVARGVFEAVTGQVAAPLELIRGLSRAVHERRFLVTTYDPAEARALEGSGVEGRLPADDEAGPRVVVGLSDATASKMSYYLRYDADVHSESCSSGRQTIGGTLTLSQTVAAADAAKLPDVITGPGDIGIPRGSQLVVVRLYSPSGGTVDEVSVAGQPVRVVSVELDRRAVVTVVAQLSGPEIVPIKWRMTSGADQTGPGQVQVTPGIEPHSEDSSFPSTC